MVERHESSPPSRALGLPRGLAAELAVVLLLALLAAVTLRSLVGHVSSHIACGREATPVVGQLNAWTLWWNADRLLVLGQGYWNAPIFVPSDHAFALGEPQPVSGILLAPFVWIGGSLAAVYNLALWLHLTANGWFAYRVTRELGGRHAGLFSGVLVVLLPFVHWQLGVFQLVPLWPTLWMWASVQQLARRRSWIATLSLAISTVATYGTCSYVGLFLLTTLPLSVLAVTCTIRQRPGFLARGGVALVLAGLLLLPLLSTQVKYLTSKNLYRDRAKVARLSARAASYLQPAARWGKSTPGSYVRVGVGWGCLTLAAYGAWAGFRRRRTRSWTVLLMAVTCQAFVLSLGPNLVIAGWSPYDLLTHIPGMGTIRNVFRYAMFVQLCLALLAAQGWGYGRRQGRRWLRNRSVQPGRTLPSILSWIWIATAMLVAVECWPPATRIAAVPHSSDPWVNYLRERAGPSDIVAVLPLPASIKVGEFQTTAAYMYSQYEHGVPTVNGYNGYLAAEYGALAKAAADFPDNRSFALLAQRGVTFILLTDPQFEHELSGRGWIPRTIRNDSGYQLWERQE